jgi:hypothetical protein
MAVFIESRGRAAWALVLMPLLALPVRCFLIVHSLYRTRSSVFDVGFGFGDYARNLAASGHFQSCLTLPFVACHPHSCVAATRMPVIPVTYAALAAIFGTSAPTIAIAKCCLLAALIASFLWHVTRDLRVSWFGVLLSYLLYFGLQPLKHGATLEYEEGMLVDLSLCLAIATLYLVRPELERERRRHAGMAVSAVLIGVILYFAKTTTLLTLLVVLLMAVTAPSLDGRLKWGLLGVVAATFLLWMMHVYATSGEIRASSSWNGENLWRGYNPAAAAIFPEITLDRAFDSTRAVLMNGTVVPLGNYMHERCFNDEWQWNDVYASRALRWIEYHPREVLQLDLKKAWVALFEIRHTPEFLSATDKTPQYSALTRVLLMLWMVLARVVFFSALLRLLLLARERGYRRYLWLPLLLGAACAPYIIVFGWQRHMVPVLIMSGVFYVLIFCAGPVGGSRASHVTHIPGKGPAERLPEWSC